VSRRVSESEEREISSSGPWTDSTLLSGFWFCVFLIAVAAVIIITKRKKATQDDYNSKYRDNASSSTSFRKHGSAKYTPIHLNGSERLMSTDGVEIDESDDDDDAEQEVDFEDQSFLLSEGVPLVMKT